MTNYSTENIKPTEVMSRFIYKRRFSPLGRKVSMTSDKPTFEQHHKYFKKHYKEYKLITYRCKPIGYLRKDSAGYISIFIDRNYRKKGVGKEILAKTPGLAIIKNKNIASIKAFQKAGYKLVAGLYEKKAEGLNGIE